MTELKLTYRVSNSKIPYSELPSFTEVIAAGTAAALVPIKSITMRSKNDKFVYGNGRTDEPGAAFTKLLTTLKGIQQGKIRDDFGWCEKVEEPPKGWLEKGATAATAAAGTTTENKDTGVDGSMDKLP